MKQPNRPQLRKQLDSTKYLPTVKYTLETRFKQLVLTIEAMC